MVTEEATPKTPEWFAEMRRERQRVMTEVLGELMEAAGIESFEELHRRFIEIEHAYIPVPGLHRGKPVSFRVFERSATGRDRFIYPQFIEGVLEVLGLDRRSVEAFDLMLAYGYGKRRGTYPE